MTFSKEGTPMDLAGMQELWASMPLAEAVVQVFQYVGDDARLQAIFDENRGRCYDDRIRFPNLNTDSSKAIIARTSWLMRSCDSGPSPMG
jgi:hypothetical protein